jgi:hypothetical protein
VTPAPSQHVLLPYEQPVGVGQIRTHRPNPSTLVVLVGPPPLVTQLFSILPMAAMVGIFSFWLGALLWSALIHPFLPLDSWMLLPAGIVWAFCGFELAMQFRKWNSPSRFMVTPAAFAFPYPTPRSRLEEVPADNIVRLRVSSRIRQRDVHALEIELEHVAFQLLRGYPRSTLDELCDLLAKELKMAYSPDDER